MFLPYISSNVSLLHWSGWSDAKLQSSMSRTPNPLTNPPSNPQILSLFNPCKTLRHLKQLHARSSPTITPLFNSPPWPLSLPFPHFQRSWPMPRPSSTTSKTHLPHSSTPSSEPSPQVKPHLRHSHCTTLCSKAA